MPITYVKQLMYHGLITDVRHALEVLFALSIVLIIIGSIVLHNHQSIIDIYDGTSQFSRHFQGAVGFTLVISLPTLIDIILSLVCLQTWDDFQQPIEFSRIYVVSIFFLPNIFIYWQVIPEAIVDLVIFYQYMCLFFVVIYRLHTLSISQPKNSVIHAYPLRDVFWNSVITMLLAFGYKLSVHGILPDTIVWKGFYTAFLLFLQFITCMKFKPWFQFTWQTSKIVKNQLLLQNKIAFYTVMIGVIACTILTLVHTITFNYGFVYFPTRAQSFVGLEWFFASVLILWTSIRNFEIRKAELATEVSITQCHSVFYSS